jgi:hypothetical protein
MFVSKQSLNGYRPLASSSLFQFRLAHGKLPLWISLMACRFPMDSIASS